MSPELFVYYRFPSDVKELVVVGKCFHIKPLLPLLLNEDRQFCILALSQNEVRLLQGTRYNVSEIELEGLPKRLDETIASNVPERQFHAGTAGRTGKREAVFHGGDSYDARDDTVRYFREIDRALHKLLHDKQWPLVIAAVDYLFPIYREVNTYSHLLDEAIAGNPEGLSPEEIHKLAWTIVQPSFQKAQKDTVAQYKQLVVSGQASNDLKEIVPAAYYGRVATLFVAIDMQRWGTFNPSTNVVHVHQRAGSKDEDLLDFVAIQTLLHSGDVYAVKLEEVPGRPPLAAVFRY